MKMLLATGEEALSTDAKGIIGGKANSECEALSTGM